MRLLLVVLSLSLATAAHAKVRRAAIHEVTGGKVTVDALGDIELLVTHGPLVPADRETGLDPVLLARWTSLLQRQHQRFGLPAGLSMAWRFTRGDLDAETTVLLPGRVVLGELTVNDGFTSEPHVRLRLRVRPVPAPPSAAAVAAREAELRKRFAGTALVATPPFHACDPAPGMRCPPPAMSRSLTIDPAGLRFDHAVVYVRDAKGRLHAHNAVILPGLGTSDAETRLTYASGGAVEELVLDADTGQELEVSRPASSMGCSLTPPAAPASPWAVTCTASLEEQGHFAAYRDLF